MQGLTALRDGCRRHRAVPLHHERTAERGRCWPDAGAWAGRKGACAVCGAPLLPLQAKHTLSPWPSAPASSLARSAAPPALAAPSPRAHPAPRCQPFASSPCARSTRSAALNSRGGATAPCCAPVSSASECGPARSRAQARCWPHSQPHMPSPPLAVSGTVPEQPVVSKKSGHLYEKRLILKVIKVGPSGGARRLGVARRAPRRPWPPPRRRHHPPPPPPLLARRCELCLPPSCAPPSARRRRGGTPSRQRRWARMTCWS